MALVGLHLLILVVLELLHSGVGRQKTCSCYTFEDGGPTEMTWRKAKKSCEYHNKYLVAMETLQEWEFINRTIKDLTSGRYNEWHIGLFKNLTTGNWTWINGRPLTIDKWQKNRPGKDDFYALIAREFPSGSYGSFNSIKGNVQRGWICEEEADNCEGTCTFQYPPPLTTTAPTRSTITELKESTRPPSTADDRTYLSESTTLPTVPSKDALQGDKNGSTTIIVAASLGALLFVVLIVLAVILLLRRKKRREKDAERPHTTASKQAESQYESVNAVEAAKLLGTPDLNTTKGESPKVECEYAVVNKANRKPKKGDLVYAELADFDDSTNDEKAAQKPAPYETTVYADVVPTDVYHKASPDPSHPTYANVQSTGV